jgi:hypothetical protein
MSEYWRTGLDHEHRITQLEDRMNQVDESIMWDRRLIILALLYGGGTSALIGADKSSDYLASLVKIALKIP